MRPELLNPNSPGARESIANADAAFRRLLAETVRQAARAGDLELDALGMSAQALADRLMQVGYGASYRARSKEALRANTRDLVRLVLLAGVPD